MPTAVLDIDLQELPPEIAVLERYTQALLLIRFRGRPVGHTYMQVQGGKIRGEALREALLRVVDFSFWEYWLHLYLGLEENGADHSVPSATVAICTRDRPEDLKRCLEALRHLPVDGQEILVVDNCPATDQTRRLVKDYGCVRYVREDKPGLNCARNRALREAKYEIVAFIDDDTIPEPGWLRALVRNFDDPLVLCVTGLAMPLELETEAQEWFERYSPFQRGFSRLHYHRGNFNPLRASRVGTGANMAYRRQVGEKVGPFDEALDGGTITCSGGDTEMFYRILAAGYHIIYDPAALVRHRHRSTWEELLRTTYGYGSGTYAFWARCLFIAGEWGVVKQAGKWFFHHQLRGLIRSFLRRKGSPPLDLLLAELRGCAVGPWAYFSSRRARRRGNLET